MFLLKPLSQYNRFPMPSIEECLEMIEYIRCNCPTKIEFAAKYKMGVPKARSHLDGLKAMGLITVLPRRSNFTITETYNDILRFNTEGISTIMYYFYTQNCLVGSWLIFHVLGEIVSVGGRKQIKGSEIKRKYELAFIENKVEEEKQNEAYKPLSGELYTYLGNFSGKAPHRSPFSLLEMFHVSNVGKKNYQLDFQSYRPHIDV
ncbi:hypothetical protein, partial [Sporomusa sp.]|uniref:hypothetical protein n=1 Tax=Sporomusa sp. TaxID=2078658 RepID=UPI002CB348A3